MRDVRDPRLFDHDPLTGVTEFFLYDPETDGFTIQSQQDVEPFLEMNKRQYNNVGDYRRYTGEWHKIASLPATIVMQLAEKKILRADGSILDEPRYRAWLNDPDNRLFRTRPGRV